VEVSSQLASRPILFPRRRFQEAGWAPRAGLDAVVRTKLSAYTGNRTVVILLTGLTRFTTVDLCEDGYEHSGSIKGGEFLD